MYLDNFNRANHCQLITFPTLDEVRELHWECQLNSYREKAKQFWRIFFSKKNTYLLIKSKQCAVLTHEIIFRNPVWLAAHKLWNNF